MQLVSNLPNFVDILNHETLKKTKRRMLRMLKR